MLATATFVQRPYLPWWLAVIIPLLAAALLLLLMLLPDHVRVPRVIGAPNVAAAQKLLEKEDLRLHPTVTEQLIEDPRDGPRPRQVVADRLARTRRSRKAMR